MRFVRNTSVQLTHIGVIAAEMSRPKSYARTGRPALAVDQSTVGGRLRALRTEARLTQDEFAERLAVGRAQVSRYETNENAAPDHVIERAAQVLGVSPAFLRYGDTDAQMAPLVGWVGDGGRVHALEPGATRYVEIPRWPDAVAFEVRGAACWPLYDDGDALVIRGDRRLDEAEALGRVCVVETQDGVQLVKRLRRGSAPGLYTLDAPNQPPAEDVPIISARPIRLHLPR
mgnify:CR=1 FL=1